MSTNFDLFLNFCVRITFVAIVAGLIYSFSDRKLSGTIILFILLFLGLFTYFTGRYYLRESYTNPSETVDILGTKFDIEEKPYETTPIEDIDDYEYNSVFENESDKELTSGLRTKLMSQYPLDWTTQPPSSSHFQKGLKTDNIVELNDDTLYKNITDKEIKPTDTMGPEMEERKILKTYKPKQNNDLNTYNVEDAYTLIKKIYDAKGEIPLVEHRKDTNIYEVVGTRKKNAKVVYDDDVAEAPVSQQEKIKVPEVVVDVLNDSDPFYNIAQKSRTGKWDYTKATPGLERMFAPTNETKQWF